MLDTLDAAAVRRWCGGGLAALRAHQHEIDELNVYPVPDGDTGTNLVLTLTSAHEALTLDLSNGDTLGRALRLMARGALLGARGNSGVIVSQILRGMADSLASAVTVRGGDLARALRSATDAAYAAVATPVEGTVLSVVAAAADAAGRIRSDDLLAVARVAASAAAEALARTPQQLPVLARAGVVDAGGRGLCLLLDALVEALSSTRPVEGDPPTTQPTTQPTASPVVAPRAASVTPGYEVQYLLDAEPTAVDRLRGVLVGLGDSLVVVGTGDGDPPTWNVHVHVDDIGAAIEAGIVAGRPHRITVAALHAGAPTHHHPAGEAADAQVADAHPVTARLPDAQPADAQPADAQPADAQSAEAQSADIPAPTGAAAEPAAGPSVGPVLDVGGLQPPAGAGVDPRARAAVVVAAGDGLTALFVAEGATVVGRNPSTAEALDAIRSTGAGRVVLLPNDANTHAVAASAAREASAYGIRVSVVPTRSPVQALAALAVRDPGRAYSDDVIAMAEAAGACRYGEVCTASREALTVAGRCRPGDLLGLLDGEVSVIGDELAEVCRRLLDRMLGGGGELATLVLGADAPADLGATLEAHLAQVWPFVEVQCYGGGQPRYHLLVGVE